MSLLANRVQQSKSNRETSIENAKESLESGKLPDGFSIIEAEMRGQANISKPKDLDRIRNESGQTIATYQKTIDKWVLAQGISPDNIPSIASKETISSEQFNYMSIHAQYCAYSKPGEAFIQAQMNAHKDPYDDKLAYEAEIAGQTKKSAELAHRRLPKEIKNILEAHAEKYSQYELENLAMKTGTYANKFRQDGNIRISTGDVVSLMYKDVHRIPELENGFQAKAIDSQVFNKNENSYEDR